MKKGGKETINMGRKVVEVELKGRVGVEIGSREEVEILGRRQRMWM